MCRTDCRYGDPLGWEEAAEEETPEPYCCVGCDGDAVNVRLGFAGYPENPESNAIKAK